MSERNGYEHGVPCWIDTWQPDARAAAGFYERVLGWETHPSPGGSFMCTLRGGDVAYIGERADLPIAWTTHVWVDDADDTAKRVTAAGGTLVAPPFDSPEGGRIVVFADPSGAVLGAWAPGRHRGARLVNESGAWSWSQLHTDDRERAKAFYGAVFGWETEAFGEATMWRVPGYVGGEPEQPVPRDVVAGMVATDAAPHWLIDFWVDDVDATIAAAIEGGGRAIVPAYDSDFFRQAVLADPKGARFSVTRITVGD